MATDRPIGPNGGPAISFITPMRRFDAENVRRIQAMLPQGHEFIVVTAPGGAAHAKNIGAAVASGEVLTFVDDDVHLMADWDWDEWVKRDWHFAIAEHYWPGPTVNAFMMRAESTMLNVLTCVFRYKLFMSGFAAVRREAFHAVGGYNESVVFEEHVMTLDFYRRRFRGARLPVRVKMLRRWHGWSPTNDTTSRGKEHPPPKPGDVTVLRT
jgi:glycosyltransferase involved in cell wall biosynthesis